MSTLPPAIFRELLAKAKACDRQLRSLRPVWLEESAALEAFLPALIEVQVKSAIEQEGDYLGAYDLAAEGIRLARQCGYPTLELELSQATALSRSGSPLRARRILHGLIDAGAPSPATYASMARTFRDFAWAERDPVKKKQLYLQATDWSAKGLAKSPPDFSSISALIGAAYLSGQIAQFAKLGGDHRRATLHRERVLDSCDKADALQPEPKDRFWLEGNRAEMALLTGDLESARRHYLAMRDHGGGMISSVAANAKVCRRILAELGHSPDLLNDCFRLPPIAIFSGHIFDAANRAEPRFPEAQAQVVKQAITRWLNTHGITEGYCALSAGGDLLFCEALMERNARFHLLLPLSREKTRKTSLKGRSKEWEERYDKVIAAAASIAEAESDSSETTFDTPGQYQYTNRLLVGSALLAAERQGLAVRPLLLWDRGDLPHPPAGGTGDMFLLLTHLGLPPEILSPSGRLAGPPAAPPPAWEPLSQLDGRRAAGRKLRTFLFADVKGYSGIQGAKALRKFETSFLQCAADILHDESSGVLLRNTWGDALYSVFASVEDAARTALRLRDAIKGLTAPATSSQVPPSLRISLHAGPVHVGHDPVIDDENYIGSHVVRTARMEPLAEGGQVLVSEEFAALIATGPHRDRYRFHYLGLARLPKNYGRMRAWELDGKDGAESHPA